jgi:peptidoglycan/xylan/chitin deacetylase (PgdA/CDA1 family)
MREKVPCGDEAQQGSRSMWSGLKRLGSGALGAPMMRRAGAIAAGLRARRLVLVYHRVLTDGEVSGGVVPAVAERNFRAQLERLMELGDIVPLTEILGKPTASIRPRFALTFDDDLPSHHDVTLPILRSHGVIGTFFLQGRSLHGLGPLWFEILDRLAVSTDAAALGRWLGVDAPNVERVARACEEDRRLQQTLEREDPGGIGHLRRDQISSLAAAGMAVGFHTVHHRALPALPQEEADAALTFGRKELEEVLGHPLTLFAYPHGKADRATAAKVSRAGFRAAWTGHPVAITRGSDPYLLGRWEAGSWTDQGFVARALAVANRRPRSPIGGPPAGGPAR